MYLHANSANDTYNITMVQDRNMEIEVGTFGTIHRPYSDFTGLTCTHLYV